MPSFRADLVRAQLRWAGLGAGRKMPLMTELVVAVRRLADEIGRKQQRTITLMARVALEPERNLSRGLDVEAWLRAGALDLVCGQDRSVLSDPGVQTPWLAETANECGAHAYYRPPRRVYDERVGLPSPDMCTRDTALSLRVERTF